MQSGKTAQNEGLAWHRHNDSTFNQTQGNYTFTQITERAKLAEHDTNQQLLMEFNIIRIKNAFAYLLSQACVILSKLHICRRTDSAVSGTNVNEPQIQILPNVYDIYGSDFPI